MVKMIIALYFVKIDTNFEKTYLQNLRAVPGVVRAYKTDNFYDAFAEVDVDSVKKLDEVTNSIRNSKGILSVDKPLILYNDS